MADPRLSRDTLICGRGEIEFFVLETDGPVPTFEEALAILSDQQDVYLDDPR
jgi:hypothetical protein